MTGGKLPLPTICQLCLERLTVPPNAEVLCEGELCHLLQKDSHEEIEDGSLELSQIIAEAGALKSSALELATSAWIAKGYNDNQKMDERNDALATIQRALESIKMNIESISEKIDETFIKV